MQFFLANTISKCQLLDSVVIQSLKSIIKLWDQKKQALSLKCNIKLKMNILDCLLILTRSCKNFSSTTISSCFWKAGFLKRPMLDKIVSEKAMSNVFTLMQLQSKSLKTKIFESWKTFHPMILLRITKIWVKNF